MAQIFYEPLARVFANDGAVGAGYKYYFYTTGTSTPISSYTTQALTVANAYPVVADSNGRFPAIWLSNLATSKVVLTDSNNVVIETQDPVGATTSTTSLNDLDVRPTSYWGLTTGTSTAYVLTANPSISAYSNVQTFFFQPHVANGAASTIAISGLSALNLKKYTGQGTKVALQIGDLQATERYEANCDGVDIVVLNPRSLPLNAGASPTLTIAVGVAAITNTGSSYLVDTEGAAATDDLDTINGGNDGQIIFVSNVADARNVVLKHNTGNIFNPNLSDVTIDVTTDKIALVYNSTLAKWIVQSPANRLGFLTAKTTNGYTYLPNGLIIQWDLPSATAQVHNSQTTITFPIAFPNGVLFILPKSQDPAAGPASVSQVNIISSTASNFISIWSSASGAGFSAAREYIAIGY